MLHPEAAEEHKAAHLLTGSCHNPDNTAHPYRQSIGISLFLQRPGHDKQQKPICTRIQKNAQYDTLCRARVNFY